MGVPVLRASSIKAIPLASPLSTCRLTKDAFSGGAGVGLAHSHRDAFLEGKDVAKLRVITQEIDYRPLAGAGVAEYVIDTFGLEHFQQGLLACHQLGHGCLRQWLSGTMRTGQPGCWHFTAIGGPGPRLNPSAYGPAKDNPRSPGQSRFRAWMPISPSFPRKRESRGRQCRQICRKRDRVDSRFRRNDRNSPAMLACLVC